MSTDTISHNIPEWTKGDRMLKALRHAHVSHAEMADYLGVSANTVGNWIAGRTSPTRGEVRLWAMRTGVPLAAIIVPAVALLMLFAYYVLPDWL